MFDSKKIDDYFSVDGIHSSNKDKKSQFGLRRKQILSLIKLTLPALAALLTGLLIVIPQLKKNLHDVTAEAIKPHKGELEKFHMEQGIFYITDYKNMVNNLKADSLDETEAGSKIIKMTNPQGTIPTSETEEVIISAPLGFYNQNTKMLKLTNGVSLIYNNQGLTTNTEEMFVDFNQSKAYGETPIVTHSDTAEIHAQGFEYYKDKNLLIYTGKSHATIKAEMSEGERP